MNLALKRSQLVAERHDFGLSRRPDKNRLSRYQTIDLRISNIAAGPSHDPSQGQDQSPNELLVGTPDRPETRGLRRPIGAIDIPKNNSISIT